jgi:hypothetical protein
MLIAFALSAFLNALLLFLVQPMFAKMLLPRMGGSPSVWSSCMLFFQIALLLGYVYAHVAPRLLGVRRQALLHGILVWVPLFVLPIAVRQFIGTPQAAGVGIVLATTALSVGLPFLVLSTSAPLLQKWFAFSPRRDIDPYVLYVASNTGSFAALIAYPMFIEPSMTLRAQALLWTVGYTIAAAGMLVCATIVVTHGSASTTTVDGPPEHVTAARRVRWVALSLTPSSLLLGVTTYLTLDVAPVPLLWIIPLALYLASFILVFSARREVAVSLCQRILPYVLLPEIVLLAAKTTLPLAEQIGLHLVTFAVLAVLCHGALSRDRPGVGQLTQFYVWVALGGALGGVLNTIIAPHVFSDLTEYPLALIFACALLAPRSDIVRFLSEPRLWFRPLVAAAVLATPLWLAARLHWPPVTTAPFLLVAAVLCFSLIRQPARFAASIGLVLISGMIVTEHLHGSVLGKSRTFFGVYRVVRDGDAAQFHTLYHGTTIHGRERVDEATPEPLTYYHRGGPIGEVFAADDGRAVGNVGVIGLGVGSLAAYARPGQGWTFYEIDPEVERIARDARLFRFLEKCGGTCSVIQGDGRLSLAASHQRYDVLVLDAFSSDAIPMHLLTVEAGALYLSHLTDEGILAFHITNRHLSLEEILARFAAHLQLAAIGRADAVAADDTRGWASSIWVVMARDRRKLEALDLRAGWKWLPLDLRPAWSDNFSSILEVVRWRQ